NRPARNSSQAPPPSSQRPDPDVPEAYRVIMRAQRERRAASPRSIRPRQRRVRGRAIDFLVVLDEDTSWFFQLVSLELRREENDVVHLPLARGERCGYQRRRLAVHRRCLPIRVDLRRGIEDLNLEATHQQDAVVAAVHYVVPYRRIRISPFQVELVAAEIIDCFESPGSGYQVAVLHLPLVRLP